MAPNMSQEAIAPVHVGDLVELDKERRYGVPDSDGGIAYVTAVNEDGTVNVRYTIKRSESFNVLPERIHSASLAVSARCRSPDEATRPSLLSPHHSPMGWNSLEGRRQQRGRSKHYKPIADVLSENRSWNYHCSEENPLMAYLRDERKKNDKGWLRLRERENAGLPAVALNKQLETTEKTMVVNIMSAFDSVQVPEGSHPMSDLAYGMAKNQRSLKYVYERFLNNNFSNERKERNDKGNNIFNSQKKRNATFTQGLMNGSYVLEGEQLWQYIKRVWETMKLTTIARTYAGHHQIVNAIVKCKGKDDFAKDHKGLHCGIRKMYVPYYESENQEQPSGVEVFESCDPVDARSLKYETPDVSGHSSEDIAKLLNQQELHVIMNDLPTDCPEWQRYSVAHLLQELGDD